MSNRLSMSFRNSITIIASPRPRVGKTLLARLVTGFHIHEGRAAAAFDLNDGSGTLAQFAPAHASHADISDIKGQMALFDRLVASDDVAKIVDIGHEQYEEFFAQATRIGLAEEARRRGIAPSILFIATPDRSSIEAYRRLRSRMPLATLTPAYNELLGPPQHGDNYPVLGGREPLRFPVLAPVLRRYIEQPPFTFADEQLANASNIPLDGHIELQRWLRKAYAELRDFEQRIDVMRLEPENRATL
jgi:hypothetical protein